jgi:hypothetical protein
MSKLFLKVERLNKAKIFFIRSKFFKKIRKICGDVKNFQNNLKNVGGKKTISIKN